MLENSQTHLIEYTTQAPFLPAAIFCGDPGTPPNAVISGKQFTQGSLVQYSCVQGRTLLGNATRYCQEDGRWSGTPPYCTGTDKHICTHIWMSCHLPTVNVLLSTDGK